MKIASPPFTEMRCTNFATVLFSSAASNCADRKSTRLNSSHRCISYAVFCLKKKHTANNAAVTYLKSGVFDYNHKPYYIDDKKFYVDNINEQNCIDNYNIDRRSAHIQHFIFS